MKRWLTIVILFMSPIALGSQPPASHEVRSVDFLDDAIGWAVGVNGSIWRTDSGGHVWESRGLPVAITLRDVRAIDAERVWVVGDRGAIFTTRDGGVTWTRIQIETTADLVKLAIGSDETVKVSARDGNSFVTKDGGSSWTAIPAGEAGSRLRPVRRPSLEPDTLVRVGDVATFSSSHYGVSGTATIVSDRLIRVDGFSSNGSAPGLDIRIGLATNSRLGYHILEVVGRQSYQSAVLELAIPEGVTLDDFDTFTIWCFEFNVLIAEGRFQRP